MVSNFSITPAVGHKELKKRGTRTEITVNGMKCHMLSPKYILNALQHLYQTSDHVHVGVSMAALYPLCMRGADGHISAAGKMDLNKLPTNESALK